MTQIAFCADPVLSFLETAHAWKDLCIGAL